MGCRNLGKTACRVLRSYTQIVTILMCVVESRPGHQHEQQDSREGVCHEVSDHHCAGQTNMVCGHLGPLVGRHPCVRER